MVIGSSFICLTRTCQNPGVSGRVGVQAVRCCALLVRHRLLRGSPGGAVPGGDPGPGVAESAESVHRGGEGLVQLVGQPCEVGECFDVAVWRHGVRRRG